METYFSAVILLFMYDGNHAIYCVASKSYFWRNKCSFSGRVPQFIIPKLRKIQGKGIKAVLVTAYGNRAFDGTLLELKDTMESCGFISSFLTLVITV